MELSGRYFCLGDIHGEYDHLVRLMRLVRKNGFSFKRGDVLVQLGDRCDRGPDTFRVNNYFYKLEKRYPGQIICLKGNHEDMMIKAATSRDTWGFLNNSGKATMESYRTFSHDPQVFGYKLNDTGHLLWHYRQPIFFETDKYLFTHAPIPKEGFGGRLPGEDFRDSPEICFWSYGGENLEDWVDPEPVPGKISVHGHIHGIQSWHDAIFDAESNQLVRIRRFKVPGVRQIGNAFMIDTGAGCAEEGYLTCLQLPEMIQYNSKGEIFNGEYEE